ncbi:MAG: carbamoyltransferase HypF [Phycisphaerae bacterium]|nr:carbamoyltransferase HypF [Phycisphaerae bacterium]
MSSEAPFALRIEIRGVVQGVGFRPFVYRVAIAHGVRGWVSNGPHGVSIHAEGTSASLDAFLHAVRTEAPPAAHVATLTSRATDVVGSASFVIRASDLVGAPTVRVSPDLCVCDDCLRELRTAGDRRYGYEYVNCTNCGPRYSIIESLPYDRARTTMHAWPLCEACEREYRDPADRRYHAQPTACPRCGPRYLLERAGATALRGDDAIAAVVDLLRAGLIVAIKGIGGYHLACNAEMSEAVATLRERKFRKDKPFAVMVPTIDAAREIGELGPEHCEALASIARPIVLAPSRRRLEGVAPGTRELGLMLPHTPLHDLLFRLGAPSPLVLTSANRSSEPIAYRDDDARERLAGLADAFLVGERPIARRVDDSVVSVQCHGPQVLRRGRGFAPAIVASFPGAPATLAVGADLKNAIALVVAGDVVMSQHIGDLGDLETDRAFDETVRDLLSMFALRADEVIVAHDLHPQYRSTLRAQSLSALRHVAVQHHAAHVAAVLAEHGRLDETVVGLALDGTGYGHDGAIWGGEVLVGSVRRGFRRAAHLRVAPLPGGDAAARFPVQAAAGRLYGIVDGALRDAPFHLPARFAHATALVERGINCFPSSSVGRLFDAAAALLGFVGEVTYEGHAAIWLENLATSAANDDAYPFARLDDRDLLGALIRDRRAGRPETEIARAFHLGVASGFAEAAVGAARDSGCRTVALSGGVMQNRIVTSALARHLDAAGLSTLCHRLVPPNDGGIALGQAAIAALGG